MNKDILNIKELSSYLTISESEIRKMVRENKIPHFRLGNRIKFNIETIEEWVKKLEQLEQQNALYY